jgi:DNA-binding NarL/FixJ family response regulator
MPSAILVALVEDDPFFTAAFVDALNKAPDMRVHGVACNLAQGMALLQGPPADVLLVDLGLPDGSGIDLIEAAQHRWPQCAVMVSTVFGDEAHVMRSLEMGAAGYLLKDSAPARLAEEIRTVRAGGSPISPLIARQLLVRFRRSGPSMAASMPPSTPAPMSTPAPPALPAGEQAHLSPREHQVLQYIGKGFSYEEIGTLMGVSRNTVLSFVRRIYAKLKVRSQIEAIHEARMQGLLAGI